MLGSAVFRTGVAPGGALAGPWVKNELWNKARSVPSLDLRFADNKSLVDSTTGQNLVTFTRASSGTYVDSQGVIRTATTNLLLRSEEFNDASWTKIGATVLANQIQSPTGTLTADEIIEDSSTGNHYATNGSLSSSVSGTVYTYSVYLKAGQRNFCFLLANGTGTLQVVSVNLSTGAATSAVGSPSSITSAAVGNGWYRISFRYTSGTTGSVGHEVRLSTDGIWGNRSYTGNGTGSVYAWGAQLEQSSTVGEYIPTTSTINSAPRFDHAPTTGESLGLLVEEARTNLSQQSDNFADVYWVKTDCTITSNESTAPDGALTADLWTNTASPGIVTSSTITKDATARTYTGSLWVKGDNTAFTMSIDDGSTTNRGRSVFNLSTGILTSILNGGTFTNTSGTITAYANGWYRLTVTTTTSTGTTIRLRPFFSGTGSSVRIWGAQVEEGAFATSYIPTTTATATRSADVASITGSNFSSWYRQDEGTVFGDYLERAFNQTHQVVSVSNGTASERISMAINSSNVLDIGVISGNVDTFVGNTPTLTAQAYRIGFAYKSDSSGVSANGSAVTDDSAVTLSTLSQLDIGARAGTNQVLNSTIRRLTYFPTRLANEVLQRITQ